MLCPWESPQYLIFSSNVPTLLYYSHLIAILAAVVFAIALIRRVRESQAALWFLITISFFVIWAVIDVLLWATNRPDLVLFYWNIQILLELLLYISAFYFGYIFITGKNPSFQKQLILSALLIPALFLIPTGYALEGIDIAFCDAIETSLIINYSYFIEILLALSLVFVAFSQIRKNPTQRLRITLFLIGIVIFLIAFSSGNIVGSLTEDWSLAQIGLFGMPVFIGFLAYSAIRFKSFNIKVFSTQALIIALWILTLSQLAVRTIENIRYIVLTNLFLFSILGLLLIRSVRREIEQREHIELLAKDLESSNKQQVALIHFISHQLKGFVSKSRNIFAMIREGEYGAVPPAMQPFIEEGYTSSTKGGQTIQEILNAANIKSGKVSYVMAPLDLSALVADIVNVLKPNAEGKGLTLTLTLPETPVTYTGDHMQLENAFRNLIDNSIKYTPQGSITLTLAQEGKWIRFTARDTGVGISPEDMQHLFTEGGHGAESTKVNVDSTGFGLYIVKNIVEGHRGTVRAESEGVNKGSTFTIELPVR